MKFAKIELPSNKKFGFFFTLVFLIATSYFFLNNSIITAYVFFALAVTFLLITFFNANALLSLNKLWMRFGQLIGMIVSPIVLGIIFFALITPYSLVMHLFGRDELRLKIRKRESHWKPREKMMPQTNFKQQF
ncbi:SxtJ family membrane protein [Candidatus Pelagibacter sp.]|jgi:hypothetical protein|nr:SxtJ family membrane protein [Candidatus Pelagibacter sp.]